MTAKKPPDWELAEKLYRAGQLSLTEIGIRIGGVSKVAVKKHMDKAGIKRDLEDDVRKAVKRKLAEDAVNDKVNGFHAKRRKPLTDRAIIEAGAQMGSAVVASHRRDIQFGRDVAGMLMSQLHEATERIVEIEEAIADEPDSTAAQRTRKAMMNRAVSLPTRAGVVRDLTTAMKNLQGLERVAFGLTDKTDESPDYETELKRLKELQPK